jgi:hypothetical protein
MSIDHCSHGKRVIDVSDTHQESVVPPPSRTDIIDFSAVEQVSWILAGSLAPVIAMALLSKYNSSVPTSVYLEAAAVLTMLAVLLRREAAHRDSSTIHADDRAPRLPDADPKTWPCSATK